MLKCSTTHAAAACLVAAAAACTAGAAANFRERSYDVKHAFKVFPGGNLPPAVDGRAFAHAWTRVTSPSGVVACEHFNVFPFFNWPFNAGFAPYGDNDLDCDDPTQGAGPLWPWEFPIGPAGFDGVFSALSNGCRPQWSIGNSRITIDPYPGFGVWDPTSAVTGEIRSFGTVHVEAPPGAPEGTKAEAYAFSSAGYTIQGLNLSPTGKIEWLPEISETVAGEEKITGTVVRKYDPICYNAANVLSGATTSGALLTSFWDLCDQGGQVQWQNDVLTFDAVCGAFEIDLTAAEVSPNGYYYFEVAGGEVVESVATGIYAGLAPALGDQVPLILPLPQLFELEYDLTGVFDALLGPAPPGANPAAGGDPYQDIDLQLQLGDAAEERADVEAGGDDDDDCVGDLDGDGSIGSTDLNVVLSGFGQDGAPGDVNGDGTVDSGDLNAILGVFGEDCPPVEQPFGACCHGDQCEVTTLFDCMMTGGEWAGTGVECFDGLCGEPVGACCFEGECFELTLPACIDVGGLFGGDGSPCDDAACAQQVGACCLLNGECLEGLTYQECNNTPGVKTHYAGQTCAEAGCVGQGGACCIDGACFVETEIQCLSLQGVYAGPGSVCGDIVCGPVFGACCLGGECVIDTKDACDGAGGEYLGDGSTCQNAECQPNPALGACCFTDGSCLDGVSFQFCVQSPGGDTFHPGKTCSEIDCPQPGVGACCFDGDCVEDDEADCVNAGGEYLGDGSTCQDGACLPNPAFGACCLTNGDCIDNVSFQFCVQIPGGGTFHPGQTCADIDCPQASAGGCCLPDGGCAVLDEASCADAGGAFQGGGTDCGLCDDLVLGTCCLGGGECFVFYPPAQCEAEGGQFIGPDADCVDCEAAALGACCFTDGSCMDGVSFQFCVQSPGGDVFHPGKACSEVDCGTPGGQGDCCQQNGTPGCNDPVCQEIVCSVNPFCCEISWDQFCGFDAQNLCPSCQGGDCCQANGTPGCDDLQCQEIVCQIDPFCCDVQWDQICADQAGVHCPGCACPGCPPPSDCCEANGTPGCQDQQCQNVVCQIDPFCCEVKWDQICADQAIHNCPGCGGAP